jgi:SAM-dependent methyltransferase
MTAHYRDYGYGGEAHPSGAAGRALGAKLVAVVQGLGGVKSVCDLGCGNGWLAGALAAAGFDVTGVDASPTGIGIAARAHGNARFVLADFDAPDAAAAIPGAPFDCVVSSDVIEHLYRPAALVALARALLAPGGHLVLGTPYHGYVKNLAIALAGRWDAHHGANWDGGHIKFFSVRTLRELVRAQGFTDVRFAFHGRAPLVWKNMVCIARRGDG